MFLLKKWMTAMTTTRQNNFNKGEKMNLDELTLGQLKEIKALVGGSNSNEKCELVGEYVIARTYSAGVFAGTLEWKKGKEAKLTNARRLWYWNGAASLSQLAMDGVSKPEECKFPCEVDIVLLTEVIELLKPTKKSIESIKGVPIWTK